MQATHDQDLEQEYNKRTPKQRAIIDAHAENPTATNREKANAAAEMLGESVNESFCSSTLRKDYPNIAVYREYIVQGEVADTKVSQNADYIPGITDDHDFDEDVIVNAEENGLLLYLPDWFIREAIESGDLPPKLHKLFVDEVVDMAFDSED